MNNREIRFTDPARRVASIPMGAMLIAEAEIDEILRTPMRGSAANYARFRAGLGQ